MNEKKSYQPLILSAGLGSIIGSGIIVGLASTITVWQKGLELSNSQVGIISGALTFAIAIGSLSAGKISRTMGLIRSFNLLNFGFLIGSMLCMMAGNYWMLLVGTILAGFFSGADLPISLTVISNDAPNDKVSAELVSATQIYWTIGILMATIIAFLTSNFPGTWSGRIEMGIVSILAFITFLIRTTSPSLKKIHEMAPVKQASKEEKVNLWKLFGEERKYMSFFLCILIFYSGWNLLANTFGQFQTFMLVKANASQMFATGAGIFLTIVCLVVATMFSKMASGSKRNVAFAIGIVIMVGSLCGLAMSNSNLWLIVLWIALQNVGSTFAGEAMYKVWTQESFPMAYRSEVQGLINGASRLLCAGFATITPILVLPQHIQMTMFGFAGLIFVAGIFGFIQIRLQKKHKIGSGN